MLTYLVRLNIIYRWPHKTQLSALPTPTAQASTWVRPKPKTGVAGAPKAAAASPALAAAVEPTDMRGWLADSTMDSEQLAEKALDECTTKDRLQLFLREVFAMALQSGRSDEQVAYNLDRASTVIKDL